jgi:hypothetical protein
LPSNRTPLVAVVHIGVQGKILFALRGLLLKNVGKPLTRPSAPPGSGWTLHPTLHHRMSIQLAFLGPFSKQEQPCAEAFTPGWKERLFSERNSQMLSLDGTIQWAVLTCSALLSQGAMETPETLLSGKTRDSLLEPYSSLGLALGQEGRVWLPIFKSLHFFK